MEVPLPLKFMCSNTFWEEDFGVAPTSGLFHIMADINGRHAALTIDNCAFTNLVSAEVVEKLQLSTYTRISPYMLDTYDRALPITQITYVPITIYGHTDFV